MAEQSLITPELRALMEREYGPVTYHIESWWLRKFAEAIDDPNPKWKDEAPPTFVTALILEDLDEAFKTAKTPATRGLNGGNIIEYFQPMRLGDTITVTGRVTDMLEREGKMGRMVILSSELTYTNQRGEVAAKGYNTRLRY